MSVATARVLELRRRDGFYYLPENRRYASVTTILQVIAKPALLNWAAKTAASLVLEDPETFDSAEKAAGGIYAKRDKAADRGSLVHSLAEALDRGGALELSDDTSPEIRGYAQAYQSFFATHKPKTLHSEATVFSDTHQYAGTTDLIAVLQDGRTYCIDRKTGKAIYPETGLQLIAYRNADFILPHGDGTTPIPMPKIDATAALLLRPDGTFSFSVMMGDFDAFLAAKRLWQWSKGVS